MKNVRSFFYVLILLFTVAFCDKGTNAFAVCEPQEAINGFKTVKIKEGEMVILPFLTGSKSRG
jgi:hypothetical protein